MDGVPGVVHLEQFLRPGLPANGLGPRLQAEIGRQVAEAVARAAGGKKTVTVKDPAGAEVYAGPLDSAEDLAQVPEEYRDWVGEVDGSQPVIRPMIPEAERPEGQHDSEAAEAAGATT